MTNPNPNLSNKNQKLQELIQVTKNRPLSDAELREFVLLIQELGTERKEKLKWLNKLIDVIQRSEKLTKLSTLISRRGCFYATTQLKDLYADALGDTFLYIAQNIDDYDPTNEVMAWVNETLRWKFLTAFNRECRNKKNNVNRQAASLDALQNSNFNVPASEPCEIQKKYRLLQEFVSEDPKNFLKNILIRRKNGNQISLQFVVLRRLDDKTYQEISGESGIPLKSISRCVDRNKAKIKDYIIKHTGIEFDE